MKPYGPRAHDAARRAANDLVLARMRVAQFVAGEDDDPAVLGERLEGLPFEAALLACFEALDDDE